MTTAALIWGHGLAVAGGSLLLGLPADAQSKAPCPSVRAAGPSDDSALRPLTTSDLARLRDIGPPSSDDLGRPILTISPDGSAIAFQLTEPNPEQNQFCIDFIVLPLEPGAMPVNVDGGNELIRLSLEILGRAASPTGIAMPITLQWTPDSRSVLYLKRVGGKTQVWRASTDGANAVQLTNGPDDVDDFRVTRDGTAIIFTTRPGLRVAEKSFAQEGLTGLRYDDRFSAASGSSPFTPGPLPREFTAIALRDGRRRVATDAEAALLAALPTDAPTNAIAIERSTSERVAFLRTRAPASFPPSTELVADGLVGRKKVCAYERCRDISAPIWWTADGKRVRYMRREGWGKSQTSIYEWTPGSSAPRRLYSTSNYLVECHPLNDDLICLQEEARSPRRVIRLNLATGSTKILYDPNPQFHELQLGQVERLQWVNSFGIESFGDLVYPTGYIVGQHYPLIVVQYQSRGFLRGGTGDEVPIQALANRGFAVLSTQNPSFLPLIAGSKTPNEADAALLQDFAGRRSILSSIETAVRALVDRRIVDGEHVGISGLSDGSSTVQFAALNSHLFKAGSVSGCCWEPDQDAILGPRIAQMFAKTGWPKMTETRPDFWKYISLAQNPDRVRFPILMQMSDDEYTLALSSLTALRQSGHPADMFIYPNEHHIKWQPSHRLAVYDRNVAWFEFWLRNIIPPNGRGREEALRWRDMTNSRVAGNQRAECQPALCTSCIGSVNLLAPVQCRAHASASAKSNKRTYEFP